MVGDKIGLIIICIIHMSIGGGVVEYCGVCTDSDSESASGFRSSMSMLKLGSKSSCTSS
jgi:hypothetical protein